MKFKLLSVLIPPLILLGHNILNAADLSEAKKLSAKACLRNEMEGCKNLGLLIYKENPTLAKKLFSKACGSGHLSGCLYLGALEVKNGKIPEGKKPLTRACNGGVMEGCNILGAIANDEGNTPEAKRMFSKACDGGFKDGCANLRTINSNTAKNQKNLKTEEEIADDEYWGRSKEEDWAMWRENQAFRNSEKEKTNKIASNFDYGPAPKDYQNFFINTVKNSLLDPDSGKFRNILKPEKSWGESYGMDPLHPQLVVFWIICGEVNSKNRFGGYVGFEPWVVLSFKGIPIGVSLTEFKRQYPSSKERLGCTK